MKLTISERVSLLNVLPPQGNVVTLRIVQELRTELGFTEKELKAYKMKNTPSEGGGSFITWDEDFAKTTKEIKIGKVANGVIVGALKKLDRQQQLHITMLPLYDKFVDGKEEEKPKEAKKK